MADFLGALKKLITLEDAKCVYCGRDVPRPGSVCGACRPKQERLLNKNGFFGGTLHVFAYEGIVRKLIHNFKYNDMPYLGAFMAEKMVAFLAENQIKFSLITFVPIHENRLAWRGFDQSEMLANYLSGETGIPCRALLVRSRDTVPQFDLAREDRQKNVKGAFTPREKSDLSGKIVLLVDDVCTTGATFAACEKVLRKMGARVIPFAFAREN
jgi:competence protein ComFC